MNRHYSIPSVFQSLPIEAYIYPAQKSEEAVVFLLKGLYSIHDPARTDSWERELIDFKNNENTFVCINTARLPIEDLTSKEAFLGKTFEQERDDLVSMFTYVTENVISKSVPIFFVAHSFGGTTLLGASSVLKKVSGIIMIASGCGKSLTTDKPLLQSLHTEERLLESLRTYPGVFIYIRGTNDTVVPRESQDKIINAATSARVRITSDIRNATHNLTGGIMVNTPTRSMVLASALDTLLVLGKR